MAVQVYMRFGILFIFISFLAARSAAQRFDHAFNRITMDDGMGLLSNYFTALYQDEKGFIWVGNSNGLQRFDGQKFVRFDRLATTPHAIPTVAINKILPAGKGRIWLASYSTKQFGIFDPARNSYTAIPLKPSAGFPARAEFSFWQDGYGNTYLSVLRYGKILKYDSTRKEFNENTPLNNLPKGWKSLMSVHHDKLKKQYWIVCDNGLSVYDESSGQMWTADQNPKDIPLLRNRKVQAAISHFYIDKQRRHWVVNWEDHLGLFCFDSTGAALGDTAGFYGVNTSYAAPRQFYETANGGLWIYGESNLYAQERGSGRFKFFRTQNDNDFGIRYEEIQQVMEDRDGMLWYATDQGLFYSSRGSKTLGNFVLSTIPGKYNVTDILELRSGEYWLSTWGEAVLTLNRDFQPYPSPLYKYVPKDDMVTWIAYRQVWAMHQQSTSGRVFLGCQRGQMMIFDTLTERTEYLHPPELEASTIRSLSETRKGEILIGTQNGKLILYDGILFRTLASLGPGVIIYKIIVDNEGLIWLGTQDMGMYAIEPVTGVIRHHFSPSSSKNRLFSGTCTDVEQLTDDLVVAATSALSIINKRTGELRTITAREGLPSNSVKRLRVDADGFLWMITDNGLSRYDHRRNTFTTYAKGDGVLLGDVVRSADHRCSNNVLIFAGVNNLLFFHPDGFRSTQRTPDVSITEFYINDEYQLLDSLQSLPEVTISQSQNDFSISFSCLDFRNRSKYTYYYQMKGLDDKWVRTDDLSVSFKGLVPGHYVFAVKAVNTEGVESADVSTVRIYVKPPFWLTGWFLSAVITFVAFIAYAMHRLRINRMLAVENVRNRVARDLHDDMGSTLSTINILSSMAKAKLNTDTTKTGEYINKISDNSQRMMEAMDDIVWAIKPANDSMQKVIGRMREFATNVLESKDIDLEFLVDKEVYDVKINMEARRDVFLIFKEAVNNAAKYSKCNKAHIHIYVDQRRLMLLVKDNGIGFDVKHADSGNGLGNMRKRADGLRATIKVQSSPGEGASVSLAVPIN